MKARLLTLSVLLVVLTLSGILSNCPLRADETYTLTVDTDASAYLLVEQQVTIFGSLRDNGTAVPSVPVHVEVADPSNATIFTDSPVTNETGQYQTNFTLSPSPGEYTVRANYSTVSAQALFIAADPTTVAVVDAYRGAILSWTPIADVDEWHLYGHGPNNASWELLATVPGANTTWSGPLPPDMWRPESSLPIFTLYYRVVPAANGTELSELAGEISDENVPSTRISCWINSYTATRDLIEVRIGVQNWSLNATTTGIVVAEISPSTFGWTSLALPLVIHRVSLRSLPGYPSSTDEYFVDYAPSEEIAPGIYVICVFVWSCLPSESGVWETPSGESQLVMVT